MLRFTFVFVFLCTSVYHSKGQYTLTQALQDASTKNSTATLIDLARQEADLKYSIASHKNLPQLNLVAQSTYQSETSGIDLSFPGVSIPRLSKDQYKAQLDISQNIYDGGAISALKDNARLEGELNAINAVADMDKIKERVILLYFGILEVDKRLENLQLVKDDLNGMEKRLTAAVQNGISLKSELNNIKVEQINVATQENELST
ncbi:MAG TPA: TolC family protein, partial [Saprospiraceae bacterium]|nr:TolC family protein [Saprospiraceae bacterium]